MIKRTAGFGSLADIHIFVATGRIPMTMRIFGALLIVCALFATAQAADFKQPARDPKFIQSARRQDKELVHFYGRLVPGGITFNHLGSYQVIVHRVGLDRPVTLVPVTSLPYATLDALNTAARTGDVVVGALKINYGMHDPEISPGTLLLVFDGLRVHLRNVHGEDISAFDATLGPVPAGEKITPVEGAVNSGGSSVAVIGPDNSMRLYLHLASASNKQNMRQSADSNKVKLSFTIPGVIEDDNTPPVKLVKPEEAKPGTRPAKP
jgi:hypothetical protein